MSLYNSIIITNYCINIDTPRYGAELKALKRRMSLDTAKWEPYEMFRRYVRGVKQKKVVWPWNNSFKVLGSVWEETGKMPMCFHDLR